MQNGFEEQNGKTGAEISSGDKTRTLLVLAVVIPVISVSLILYGFKIKHDKARIGFDGYVYDEETTRPIKGAQIYAKWWGSRPGIGQSIQDYYATVTTETDANGYYSLPSPKAPKKLRSLHFDMWLYKAGYICYTQDGGFKNVYKSDFKQFQNIIYLKRWNLGEDRKLHGQHHMFVEPAGGCELLCFEPQRVKNRESFCREVLNEFFSDFSRCKN